MLISYQTTRDEIVQIISIFRIIISPDWFNQNLRLVQQVIFSLELSDVNSKLLLCELYCHMRAQSQTYFY